MTMFMIQGNCGRFYAQYYTLFLERYSPISDKISKIRDFFSNTDSFTLPVSDVPKFDLFTSISDDEMQKVIIKSPTNLQLRSLSTVPYLKVLSLVVSEKSGAYSKADVGCSTANAAAFSNTLTSNTQMTVEPIFWP